MTRYDRYAELMPVERLRSQPVVVVGVGAVGRQVALMLGSMGVENLTLIDYDTVDEVNLGCQGWRVLDLGKTKVRACLDEMEARAESHHFFTGVSDRFRASQVRPNRVWFMCVDKIEVRDLIVRMVWPGAPLVLDSRMAGESGEILTIWDEESRAYYQGTLFGAGEATGRCTTQSTIYGSNVLGGMLVAQYAKWLRGVKMDRHIEVSILGNVVGPV